jgi:hypothetical protein
VTAWLRLSNEMRGLRTLGLAVALLALLTDPVFAQKAGTPQAITWTAGPLGGGWFDISTGMAALLQEKANLAVRVIPGGGAQNPVLVDKGDAAIGLGLPPLLGAAVRAEDPYRRKMESLRALAGNMSPSVLHFYVAAVLALPADAVTAASEGRQRVHHHEDDQRQRRPCAKAPSEPRRLRSVERLAPPRPRAPSRGRALLPRAGLAPVAHFTLKGDLS